MADTKDDSWTCYQNNVQYRILNDFYADYILPPGQDSRSFSRFLDLPLEIRQIIWSLALRPRRRLISMRILKRDEADIKPGDDDNQRPAMHIASPASMENCNIRVETVHRQSPLLSVCSESRQVARSLYRVDIPYTNEKGIERRLFLAPDWDIIEPRIQREGDADKLVDFLCHLRVSDPRKIGVRYLSVKNDDPFARTAPFLPHQPHLHDHEKLEIFRNIITNLTGILFSSKATIRPRLLLGWPGHDARYNRSFPLVTAAEEFELLPHDPRRIHDDLQHVAVGSDPRRLRHAWEQMLQAFAILEPKEATYKYLLRSKTGTEEGETMDEIGTRFTVRSRTDASTFLAWEEDQWRQECFPRASYVICRGVGSDMDGAERMRDAPISAFGFWLFPLNAFDKYASHYRSHGRIRWHHQSVMNLSDTRPMLGLAYIPD